MTMTDEKPAGEPSQIAGFWRRLLALFIDSILLGVLGACLGFVLYDYFASIGGWGRVIGFVIATAYFGVMNSRICGGQTIGKIAQKIKVSTSDGMPLSVGHSFCRATILCVPCFLNGAPFDMELIRSWFGMLLSLLIFGVGLSIVYMYVFNRRTRQSLHDLAVGSFVVRAGTEPALVRVPPLWRGHFAVLTVFMLLAAGAPLFTGQLAETEPFASLLPLQKALASEPGVRRASVHVGTSSVVSVQQGSLSRTNLSAQVLVESKDVNCEALANKLAQITLSSYAEAAKKDVVVVSITYGYDIGIASAWQSQNFAYSPSQWRERLVSKS